MSDMDSSATKLSIDIKEVVHTFNDKVRRMSNQDYDFNEILLFVICGIRVDMISETSANEFTKHRFNYNALDGVDSEILRDAYVYLYTRIELLLKPWKLIYSKMGLSYIDYDGQYLWLNFGV